MSIYKLSFFEPIFALATSSQKSALHLHRLSGQGVIEGVLSSLLNPKKNTLFAVTEKTKFPLVLYANIYEQTEKNKKLIDDVIVTFFKGPHSFTGEDTVEISCHGNKLITQKLQTLFRSLGFRDAKPGEFTQRAMLLGKLDLTKAEAIHELISAETHGALDLARNNLNGFLSAEILNLRELFVHCLSYLEAHIDFAPDEVGTFDGVSLLPTCEVIEEKLFSLKKSYSEGLVIKEGVKIVLCGEPNFGKSTLFNELLQENRAIVTDIPGTTRDVLSERLIIDHHDFVLLDTAGVRQTTDRVERLGIERTKKSMQEAQIICVLLEANLSIEKMSIILKNMIGDFDINHKKIVVVLTKKDLVSENKIVEIKKNMPKICSFLQEKKSDFSSLFCFTGKSDSEELKQIFVKCYEEITDKVRLESCPMLISARQKNKVEKALDHLKEAKNLLKNKDVPEKTASLLNSALISLEEIVGEVDLNLIYEKIFSSFCIGK